MLKLRRMNKEYTHAEVLDIVRKHEMSLYRELKLEAYYKNDNIINRTIKPEGKANHKVAHPFAHQLVSTFVGYVASEPVQFDIENEQVKGIVLDNGETIEIVNDETPDRGFLTLGIQTHNHYLTGDYVRIFKNGRLLGRNKYISL